MSVKKAAGAVRQALQKDALRQQGYTWIDMEQYEHEVNVLQRFLVDTSVSGGKLPKLLGECGVQQAHNFSLSCAESHTAHGMPATRTVQLWQLSTLS